MGNIFCPRKNIPEVKESIKEEVKNPIKDENYEAPSINQNLDDKISAEDEEERIPPIKEPVHQEAEPLGEDTVITVLDDIKIGLNNIGATCYMNSTIQCLSNTKELTYYFLNKFNPKDKNKIISNEFYEVLKCLWNQEKNNKPYSPTHFKEVISKENPLFEGVQACDSKDLINFLLERMHKELNIKINEIDNDNDDSNNVMNNPEIQENKEKIYEIFIKDYKNNYNSIISDLFYGINETKTHCQICNRIKYNYEVFSFLEFPLHQVNLFFGKQSINNKNPDINLYECFQYNQKEEYLTGENALYCNFCKNVYDSYYSSNLFSMPRYLCIILNRDKGNSYECNVNFPETLDLSKYVCNNEVNKIFYDLYAVISHLGTSSISGHFIAF